MKKLMLVGALCAIGLLCLTPIKALAENLIASRVDFYHYPAPLPNSDSTLEFGVARDNFLTGIKNGGLSFTTSGSRVGTSAGNVTAIEIKNVFDATDIMVSSTSNLWRGQFYPPSPYNAQYGNRAYDSVLVIGRDGKVCVDRMSYQVTCGTIPLLGNNSSLSGLSYSVSRIGINAGADGILFTADDVIINTGSGTNLVDAIAFIGGRIGALVNSQTDINNLNNAIGSNGTWINWKYVFTGPDNVQSSSITIPLYQAGHIPWVEQYNRIVPMVGPQGVLFSIVGEPNSSKMNLYGAHNVDGPYTLISNSATEGTSVSWPFTWNPTNDYGFYRIETNTIPVVNPSIF